MSDTATNGALTLEGLIECCTEVQLTVRRFPPFEGGGEYSLAFYRGRSGRDGTGWLIYAPTLREALAQAAERLRAAKEEEGT